MLPLIALLLGVSCDEGDAVIGDVIDNVTRGAVMRTIAINSSDLPIGDPTANFSLDFEVQDIELGTLVTDVDVFVAFRDNTVLPGATDLDVAESLFTTISASTFEVGPFGLPRGSFTAPLADLLAFTGVAEADIFGGDQFQIRFELVLSDGRTFSSTNSNPNNLGGSFFSSPFLYFPTVICPVPETFFTGTYSMTQLTGSAPFGIGDGFTQPSVEIVADGTSRSFQFLYDPAGFDSAYTMSFALICNEIQGLSGSINSGSLGCGDGSIGQTVVGTYTYDINVPVDAITFVMEDFNPDGGCSGNTYEFSFTLTKL